MLADGDGLSWTAFNHIHSWTSGLLEPSAAFNLGVSLRPVCFIRRVEYEMAHCVLLEYTHLSHPGLNQTKSDAKIDLVAGCSLPWQRLLSLASFEERPFCFALFYWSFQSRLLGASHDAFAPSQILSIVLHIRRAFQNRDNIHVDIHCGRDLVLILSFSVTATSGTVTLSFSRIPKISMLAQSFYVMTGWSRNLRRHKVRGSRFYFKKLYNF